MQTDASGLPDEPAAAAEIERERTAVRRHYTLAGPLLEKHFANSPLISVGFPSGFGSDPVYYGPDEERPATISPVDAVTSTGKHTYVALTEQNLTWLCATKYAVEFHSWTPLAGDPQRAAYARLTLTPCGAATDEAVAEAAQIVRIALQRDRLESILVLDGFRGASLWIPFGEAPAYAALAAFLVPFVETTAAANAKVLTTSAHRADRGDRVYLGTKANHPGNGTLLPYALRGTPELEVSLPVPWTELGRTANGSVRADTFEAYLATQGDPFETLRKAIAPQNLPPTMPYTQRTFLVESHGPSARGYIINAAKIVLADGEPHDAGDICQQAQQRRLLPKSTTGKYVYTALHEYVVRTIGAGKVPEIVQLEGTSRFRLNRPADEWPAVPLPPLPRWLDESAANAAVEKLRATSTGNDPAAFEIAVCEALTLFGAIPTHFGGNGEPDALFSVPLGIEGYRVVLECKTASPGGIVSNPRPEEAAKFLMQYNARYALLLGPAFGNDAALDAELKQHDVALWTVDDLATILQEQIPPHDLRPFFAPGRAAHMLVSYLWERDHGRRKRIAVIADLIARQGWAIQVMLARGNLPASQTPQLTEETLLMLVDEELAREGISTGAMRDELQEALHGLRSRGMLRLRADGGYVISAPPALLRS